MTVGELKEELNGYDDDLEIFDDDDCPLLGLYEDVHPYEGNKHALYFEI